MKVRDNLLKAIAKFGYKSAMNAGGTASQYGTYQAKEPKAISEIRSKKNA